MPSGFAGSSRVTLSGSSTLNIGNTGPTGPTGSTGSTGPMGYTGNTGPTGAGISGMFLSSGFLRVTFDNEASFISQNQIKGPSGGYATLRTYGENIGSGYTFYSERIEDNDLKLRVLKSENPEIIKITTSSDEVVVDFDVASTGYINITGITFANSLLAFGAGNTLFSIPRNTFNPNKNSVSIVVKDYKEKAIDITERGVASTIEDVSGFTFEINPDEARVFAVDLTAETPAPPATFSIKTPTSMDTSQSFMLIVKGATGTSPATRRFYSNDARVLFPYGRYPCFSGSSEPEIFTFFWLNDHWYGNLVKWGDSSIGYFDCNDSDPASGGTDTEGFARFQQGITGACCTGITCEITDLYSCSGYFQGAGTTCGGMGTTSGGICDKSGACCITNRDTKNSICRKITCNQCVSFNLNDSITSSFHGNDSECKNVDCLRSYSNLGACCNGLGECFYTEESECFDLGGFFQGLGSVCNNLSYTYNSNNEDDTEEFICTSATGACCFGVTCSNNYTFDDCISENGLYAGKNSLCQDISCQDFINRNNVTCSGRVLGVDLYPGDLYAGGMVVGTYNPYYGVVLGAKTVFTKTPYGTTSEIMTMEEISSEYYRTVYDNHGYGFGGMTSSDYLTCSELSNLDYPLNGESKPDSYIMIVSLEPVAIDAENNYVSYSENRGYTHEFPWSNYGCSWGPYVDLSNLATSSGIFREEYTQSGLYSEGYWLSGNTYSDTAENIKNRTFSSCREARALGDGWANRLRTRSLQTINGFWRRNWGLYNSLHLAHADNINYLSYTPRGSEFSYTDFGPALTGGDITSIRATRLMDDNLTSPVQGTAENSNVVSQWFLPSYDEMAFLAAHCSRDSDNPYGFFDLNSALLSENKIPITGWHWTSTGSFDSSENEGIFDESGVTSGSSAWAMYFSETGMASDFKSARKNRFSNRYMVRPIRLIRCDGNYGAESTSEHKAWNIPTILRDNN
jgi:hypothetical protein